MSIFGSKGPTAPPPPPPTPTRADASVLDAGSRAVAPPSYISSGSAKGLARKTGMQKSSLIGG